MSLIKAAGAGEQSTGFYDHLLDQSLKFDDGKTQYLTRTPASASNQKTWTWSSWVKLGRISGDMGWLWGAQGQAAIYISDGTNTSLRVNGVGGGDTATTLRLRDPSSFYHFVVAVDTTDSTAGDRLKIYINGVRQTAFDFNSNPTLNADTYVNSTNLHIIGYRSFSSDQAFDGYLAEVNFIDGAALTPSSFGETKDGIWIPKDTSGLTFGTNGFHLTFKDDVVSEGFNAVTWRGSAADNSISGIGFSPAFVWIKDRTDATAHYLFDVNRGALKDLYSNLTNAEYSASQTLKSFDADGFTVGNNTGVNGSADDMVAWCWEGGGTPTATNSAGAGATPTAGSVKIDGSNLGSALAGTIPATKLTANTARGFSIVGYEATGTAGTIAHGLSAAPEFIIIKHRDQAGAGWPVYFGDNTDVMYLGESYATGDDANAWNDTSPTSTVFSVGPNGGDTNNSLGGSTIAYCFHSVSGYSKFGSFTGNGGSQAIDVGFTPAFVLMKRTNSSSWGIFDNTRQPANTGLQYISPNGTQVETTNANMVFSGNTFNDNGYISDNGETVIYMAFADTREAAFFKDVSSNGNHFTPVNLDYRDSVPDVPTNSFCTLNPLMGNSSHVHSEGNLKVNYGTAGWIGSQLSTMGMASGKYYWEVYVNSASGSVRALLGIESSANNYLGSTHIGNLANSVSIYSVGTNFYVDGSATTDSEWVIATGNIVMFAYDADNGTLWIGKNGTWWNSATSSEIAAGTTTNAMKSGLDTSLTWLAGCTVRDGATVTFNFGQDSSFAGNHATANANADANGHGSFAYAPPSGFLALCSQNLPDVDIIDGSENFNTVLYTGNASTNAITGVGFSPDWLWLKKRGASGHHFLFDEVRGADKQLKSSISDAETSHSNYLASFDADGFTIGSDSDTNANSVTHVAWNWLAGTAFSNDASATSVGTIDSSGQVNTTAGFSIIKYTGNGATGATVAHGLSSALQFYIIKNRDAGFSWTGYHEALGAGNYIQLDSTGAASSTSDWNSTAPTSSVFTVSGDEGRINKSGTDYIAYCFHSVEGYSKVGSFVGNGNADGTFVPLNFRASWILMKRSDGSENWLIYDTERDPHNVTDEALLPNSTSASGGSANAMDILSNGFKLRATSGSLNASGGNYIYLAFASQPFKFSNAR
jgi:hypothetical protein